MAEIERPVADRLSAGQPATRPQQVVVKKYANRRLYNTETSSYITLENLAEMIRAGRDFAVFDAKSGDDITRGVLTQIIVEEESKGSAMLPTAFLRQLIGFYGHSMQGAVPSYLEEAMSAFTRQQQQVRAAISPFMPPGFEELGRQNIAIMERAMSMFNPFLRGGDTHKGAASEGAANEGAANQAAANEDKPSQGDAGPGPGSEMAQLRAEVESLRMQLAAAHADAVMAQTSAVAQPPANAPAAVQRMPSQPTHRLGRKAGH